MNFVIRAYPVEASYPADFQNAFVSGFKGGMVIKAFSLDRAKHFKTEKAALAWLAKHADLGYGLESNLASVEVSPC